ncbi:MAG TPA: argininosuccinate lyase [Candidatus Krumholzibacteria bacterium]|nr:argininosuccinate lyase [Candidatus Krumholzibacteria bacterium]
MKMWTGRFDTQNDADFEQWQRSFPYDRRLIGEEVAASKAYAYALEDAGVLMDSELHAITTALDAILAAGIPADDDPAIEDVHHYVEHKLVEAIGETGYKLHTGRSRNEQIATNLRLFLRAQSGELEARLRDLSVTFLERAETAGEAVMPCYTHLQRAEPVLVAHWWMAYAEMILRDIARLRDGRVRMNECPLGSGAVTGTVVPIDRDAMARRHGFDRPTANSMDATSDRDFAVEFAQSAALLATHLSRLAEDLILFATQEFGFVRISDAYSTGSSALPQKKNPDALELVRAHAATMIGNATTLLTCMKGLPLAYNKDLQETQRPLFDSVDRSLSAVRIMTGVIGTLELNEARMSDAARRGGMQSLALAARIARDGVPFRRAHEMVGSAVRLALKKDCELEQLSDDDWQGCGVSIAGADLRACMETATVLDLHDVHGGTAPARVSAAIEVARERLAALRGAVGAHS